MEVTSQRMVREIPARFKPTACVETNRIVVCAYARVSTDKDEQEDSFERQVNHYTQYINSRSEWQFGGIYADPGITGTSAEKRPDFQRMINDCRAKKIDKILVKSIARFARNTVDALTFIRELREIGISIFFENENIDTMTPNGEVILTILAAMAEQESRNISTNIKWAYQKKFKNGDVALNCARFLGYTKDKNKKIIIVPEEAKVILRIYREYLCGFSIAKIANNLTADGIPSPSNKTQWYPKVIQSILNNEKYKGSALLGKTFKPDVLSPKRLKNEGQAASYFIDNSHQEIISKETFEMVQAIMASRASMRGHATKGLGKYSSKYPFSTMLVCGECGSLFRRHAQQTKDGSRATWVCNNRKRNGVDACKQKYLMEEDIEQAYLRILKRIVGDASELKTILTKNIASSLDDTTALRLAEVTIDIEKLQDAMLKINQDKRSSIITEAQYYTQGMEIGEKIDSLHAEQVTLQGQADKTRLAKHRIEDIIEALNQADITEKFDGETFKTLVQRIVIKDRNTIEVEFKCGIKEIENL